jgi:type IV pilus assembly protein PilQ
MRKKLLIPSLLLASSSFVANAASLENMHVKFINDQSSEIKFEFENSTLSPTVVGFDNNILHFKFDGGESELSKTFYNIDQSWVKNVKISERAGGLHVYVTMDATLEYKFKKNGTITSLQMTNPAFTYSDLQSLDNYAESSKVFIEDIQFEKESNLQSRLTFLYNSPYLGHEVIESEGGVELVFNDVSIPSRLFRNQDTSKMNTSVDSVVSVYKEGNTHIKINFNPKYEVSFASTSYDNKLLVLLSGEVKGEGDVSLVDLNDSIYFGDNEYAQDNNVTFNFQNMPVRDALYVLAKKTGDSVILADNINGYITLNLVDVPAQQALDLILKSKGLDKRTKDKITMIALAEDIASREEMELKSKLKMTEIVELDSETIQIKYAKAEEVSVLIDAVKSCLVG